MLATVRRYLPTGNTLTDEVFAARHDTLCLILALHLPALYVLGVWRGYGFAHTALEVAVPLADRLNKLAEEHDLKLYRWRPYWQFTEIGAGEVKDAPGQSSGRVAGS